MGPAALVILLGLGFPRVPASAPAHVLVAVAFSEHASPQIRPSDAVEAGRRFPELADRMRAAADGMAERREVPVLGVRRSPRGEYLSDQFWTYGLLAAPFVRLGAIVSVNPAFGFAWLNACAVLLVNAYLGRAFDSARERFQARMLFLACGTSFYLGWADPVVLTACAMLVATLAATRAELGVGMVAAGLAASLSPSAVVIVIFVMAWWLRLRLWPDTSISGPTTKPALATGDWIGSAAGIALTALPYWFFRSQFGVSHPGARAALDPRLITAGRFESFFFDWNQGMVVGVPGLMFALSIATYAALFGSARSERKELLRGLFFTDLALTFMVVPALAVRDFNAESSVFLRSAYFRAMPLLGSLFALLPRLPSRFERPIVIACGAAQLAVIAWNGPTGAGSNHLRFTEIAELALTYFPNAYDPDPEIFRERTLGREEPANSRRTANAAAPVLWPADGRPQKILAPAGVPLHVPRLCGPRRTVTSASVARVTADERYLDAPFRCSEE